MKPDKTSSNKFLKNIDWKSFFNMRIFRYSFFKQLNSPGSYICFFIVIVMAIGINTVRLLLPVWGRGGSIDEKLYQYNLFLFVFSILIIFIFYKSVKVFRDEIDDGTLLIINSMSYSRLRIVIQKWLSLQVVCSIFVLSVVLITPIVSAFLTSYISSLSFLDTLKFFYKDSLRLFVRLTIIQILASSLAILISLYFGQKAIMAFGILFGYILTGAGSLLYIFCNFDLSDGWTIYIILFFIGLVLSGLFIFNFNKKDFA